MQNDKTRRGTRLTDTAHRDEAVFGPLVKKGFRAAITDRTARRGQPGQGRGSPSVAAATGDPGLTDAATPPQCPQVLIYNKSLRRVTPNSYGTIRRGSVARKEQHGVGAPRMTVVVPGIFDALMAGVTLEQRRWRTSAFELERGGGRGRNCNNRRANAPLALRGAGWRLVLTSTGLKINLNILMCQ
ncbi:hypothetical protein EVAR_51967_1 [Eumeta japonica]|uniref:Uncharacterized protein n=1 Tax=Eumeta variegata TaxID=151549 RepID=A0A4C1Y495_EUMVA|nr:hypothetical protein EVAR_51967_1 [Eumeta japonica]